MENKYQIKKNNKFYYKVISQEMNGQIKDRYFQRYSEALDCFMQEGIRMYAIKKGGFNSKGFYLTPVALMFAK